MKIRDAARARLVSDAHGIWVDVIDPTDLRPVLILGDREVYLDIARLRPHGDLRCRIISGPESLRLELTVRYLRARARLRHPIRWLHRGENWPPEYTDEEDEARWGDDT